MKPIQIDLPRVPEAVRYLIYRKDFSDSKKKGKLTLIVDESSLATPYEIKKIKGVYAFQINESLAYELPHRNIVSDSLKIFYKDEEITSFNLDKENGIIKLNQKIDSNILNVTYSYYGFTVYDSDEEQVGVERKFKAPSYSSVPNRPHSLCCENKNNEFFIKWSNGVDAETNYYYTAYAETEKGLIQILKEQKRSLKVIIDRHIIEFSYDNKVFWPQEITKGNSFKIESVGMPPAVNNLIAEERFNRNKEPFTALFWDLPRPWIVSLYIRIKSVSKNNIQSPYAQFQSRVNVPTSVDSVLIKRKKVFGHWHNDWPSIHDSSNIILNTEDEKITNKHFDTNVENNSYYNYCVWTKTKDGSYSIPKKTSVHITSSISDPPTNFEIKEEIEKGD